MAIFVASSKLSVIVRLESRQFEKLKMYANERFKNQRRVERNVYIRGTWCKRGDGE